MDWIHEVNGGLKGLQALIDTPTKQLPPGAWKPKPLEKKVRKAVAPGSPPWPGAVLTGDPPRWHNPHTGEAVGTNPHADTAASITHTADIPDALKKEYAGHMAAVLERMPEASRKAALAALDGGKAVFHADTKSVGAAWRKDGGKISAGEEIGGFVTYRDRFYDHVELHLDGAGGGATAEGVYAHELGHLVDLDCGQSHSDRASADAGWVKAWKREIHSPPAGKQGLSPYARTDESEGMAELYRHIHESGLDSAKSRFPKCVAFLESKGLL